MKIKNELKQLLDRHDLIVKDEIIGNYFPNEITKYLVYDLSFKFKFGSNTQDELIEIIFNLYEREYFDLDDETRIEQFKQKYENEMITSEELDLLWCDTIIKTIEFCGLSGIHPNHEYYTIHFSNGDNIDVYLSKEDE